MKEELDIINTSLNSSDDSTIVDLQTNQSSKSHWTWLKNIVAEYGYILKQWVEKEKDTISKKVSNEKILQKNYYIDVAKSYQHGDTLYVIDGVVGYQVEDESSRIIALASATEDDVSGIVFKVLKQENENYVHLNAEELEGFLGFLSKKILFGTKFIVVSENANVFSFTCDIELDSSVFNSSHETISEGKTVIDIINEVSQDFLKTKFNNSLLLTDFEQEVKNKDGVLDFRVSSSFIDGVSFSREKELSSGHYVIGTTTINYVS